MAKNKPIHEVRVGRIRAAIWANTLEDGTVLFNTTIERLYRNGEDWKSTPSFGRDDLLTVANVAHLAYLWVQQAQQDDQAPSVNEA